MVCFYHTLDLFIYLFVVLKVDTLIHLYTNLNSYKTKEENTVIKDKLHFFLHAIDSCKGYRGGYIGAWRQFLENGDVYYLRFYVRVCERVIAIFLHGLYQSQ